MLILLAAALCLQPSALAGGYREASGRNPWNAGANAAGMRQDTLSGSFAELYGSYVTGGLRSASEAASAWSAGARAASLKHLRRFSMSGSFGFEQMQGEGMAGSMFIKPGFYPVNVYEFTPGSKTLQTYSFSGGLSVDLGEHLRIGGRMDFESSNYAKRKDLRHTNYRLDMTVAPGIQWHSGPLSVGANFIFSKNSETVNAEQVGSNVSSYEVFFDEGLYYGTREIWTGSGVHLSEAGVSGFPVAETIVGAALQASWRGIYADVQWRSRSGFAGEKQTVWYRFPGSDIAVGALWRFRTAGASHSLRAQFTCLDQSNYETVLDKVTEGGVTTTVEYGSNLIFSRRNASASVDYSLSKGAWGWGLKVALSDQSGTVSNMYPYVMTQHLLLPSLEGRSSLKAGGFAFSLALRWAQGAIWDKCTESVQDSGVAALPVRLDSYYAKYKEHLTSYKINVAPAVRYDFGGGLYAEASAQWLHGFEIKLLGSDRINAGLRLGYNF